jgi:hypothetical protein
MQRYTIFFITVNFLHVSGGFSAHHQELKTVHTASGMSSLLAVTARHVVLRGRRPHFINYVLAILQKNSQ